MVDRQAEVWYSTRHSRSVAGPGQPELIGAETYIVAVDAVLLLTNEMGLI
jgi:hypothetical protein